MNRVVFGAGAVLLAALLVIPAGAQTVAPLAFQTFEKGEGFAPAKDSKTEAAAEGFAAKSTKSVKLSFETSGFPEGNLVQSVIITPESGAPVDISAHKFMFFWIKDTQGANTHWVTLTDAAGAKFSAWFETKSTKDVWTKVYFPVANLTGIDKTALKQVEIGEWNAGTYYFDEVYFANALAGANGRLP